MKGQRGLLFAMGIVMIVMGALVFSSMGCQQAEDPAAEVDLGDKVSAAENVGEVAVDTAGEGTATDGTEEGETGQPTSAPAPSPNDPASFISLCANCHDSLDKELDWRTERKLVFNHSAHFAQGIRCVACHREFPHKPGRIEHVTVETCFECHGTRHGDQGVLAPTTCDTCHTPDIPLSTADHKLNSWTLQPGEGLARHSRMAETRRLYCKMCHEGQFCEDCHGMEMPHPEDWMSGAHGEQAKESGKGSCIKCHETQSYCDDCHHQTFPRLVDWGGGHKTVVKSGGADACFECHEKPEEFCSPCHVRTGRAKGVLGE